MIDLAVLQSGCYRVAAREDRVLRSSDFGQSAIGFGEHAEQVVARMRHPNLRRSGRCRLP
ncbi:hypothetical protein D3C83_327140 [compost metagenome]